MTSKEKEPKEGSNNQGDKEMIQSSLMQVASKIAELKQELLNI